MINELRYFLRYLLNKLRKQKCPSHAILRNNLPEDKKKYVLGTVSLCYCGGLDCIIAKFWGILWNGYKIILEKLLVWWLI